MFNSPSAKGFAGLLAASLSLLPLKKQVDEAVKGGRDLSALLPAINLKQKHFSPEAREEIAKWNANKDQRKQISKERRQITESYRRGSAINLSDVIDPDNKMHAERLNLARSKSLVRAEVNNGVVFDKLSGIENASIRKYALDYIKLRNELASKA